jgi:hypothetical protein
MSGMTPRENAMTSKDLTAYILRATPVAFVLTILALAGTLAVQV